MRFYRRVIESFLTPRDLATAIGVSESSLKRWADEGFLQATRTAGGHRRISLSEAVRFIRETRCTVVRPDILGFGDVRFDARLEPGYAGHALLEALERDDQKTARGLLLGEFLSGSSIAAILDGSLRVALEKIGERWKDAPAGIVLEHRAVDTAVHALSTMRSAIPKPGAGAPCAVGGSPSGDPFVLPSLGAAIVLAEAGYVEMNLGAESPIEAMLAAVDRYRPAIVWRSVTRIVPARAVEEDLLALAERVAPWGGWVVVGGQSCPDPQASIHARVRALASMSDLARFARSLPGLVAEGDAGSSSSA